MDRAELSKQLAQLEPALNALTEPYCIIGSAALILAGGALGQCDDIDILTNAQGATRLSRAWKSWWNTESHPQGHKGFRSQYTRYLFPHGYVEVMGDLQMMRDGQWHEVVVHEKQRVQGLFIPTLAEQERLLRWFGREKDQERLKLFY